MSDNRAAARAGDRFGTDLAEGAALDLFLGMLGRTHLTSPAEVAAAVAEQVQVAGGADAVIYLVDYEQQHLLPVPVRAVTGISTLGWDGRSGVPGSQEPVVDLREGHAAVPVEGSVPGRCFAATEILQRPCPEPGRRRLWVPLLDGTDRLGVFTLTVPYAGDQVPDAVVMLWERFTHMVAQTVVGKGPYGDAFELVRRNRPMALAGELQWAMLPPLVFAGPGLVVSAMLEPCYEDGGDAFDYAVN